jgi:N-acetylmuramoyl-L-alanine amidase
MTIPTSDRPRRRIQRDGARQWLDTLSLVVAVVAIALIFITAFQGAGQGNVPPSVAAPIAVNPTATTTIIGEMPSTPVQAEPTVVVFPTATPILETPTPEPPTATPEPTFTPAPPTPTFTPTPPLVAIIVGHRNNDSGAICEGNEYDGLQEVQITTAVTEELVPRLEDSGYSVMTLDEFDQRLYGLQASALVSIHVDSCVTFEGTTGFKVARPLNSAIPDIEDRFVQCMDEEYKQVTGLEIHSGSITHNMTNYHAFSKVDLNTPAIIIEVGFLYFDHDLLVDDPDRVAVGLRNGITCFLKDS